MDICRNISVSGGLQYQQQPQPEYQLGSLDDLFPGHPLEEEGDVNMEWLSTFVEECFSSNGNCLLPPATTQTQPFQQQQQKHLMKPTPNKPTQSFGNKAPLQFDKLVIPVKGTRSKRKRSQSRKTKASWWSPPPQSDPPLLHQAYWLADSELIFPQKQQQDNEQEQEAVVSRQGRRKKKKKKKVKNQSNNHSSYDLMMEQEGSSSNGIRRCTHCLSQRTPQWRAGPLGPKTLCNACGVRYKSGRLLPEYRPAKSPSFVSYMHSNSHKKVLEMRTLSLLTSDSSSSSPT